MGRGDNDKRGSAGRGSGNQSNQPFAGKNSSKSNRNKKQTGNEPSIEKKKIMDQGANRERGNTTENLKPLRTDERNFNLLVDEVPYFIKASAFTFNGETRFYISVNGGSDHVFTWDSDLKRLRAIDDKAATLPDALEEAISHKLQSQHK